MIALPYISFFVLIGYVGRELYYKFIILVY